MFLRKMLTTHNAGIKYKGSTGSVPTLMKTCWLRHLVLTQLSYLQTELSFINPVGVQIFIDLHIHVMISAVTLIIRDYYIGYRPQNQPETPSGSPSS